MISPPAHRSGGREEHVVQIYATDAELVAVAGERLRAALDDGGVAVVIATEEHRRAFEEDLAAHGFDVGAARSGGTYLELDATGTLGRFTEAGALDLQGLLDHVGGTIEAAVAVGRPLWIFGEMVALLWEAGDVLGAIELEAAWDVLGKRIGCSIYCAYRNDAVAAAEHGPALERMCAMHSAVVPMRSASATWDFEPGAASAAQARRLLTEMLVGNGYESRLLDDARLVVGELTANAILHARSPFSVKVRCQGPLIRIEVRDGSRMKPFVRNPDASTPSGRGLRLVSAVARSWGVEPQPDGKSVWAEL